MIRLKTFIIACLFQLFAGLIGAQCPAPKACTYPVISGFIPNPSVVRVGDDYYFDNSIIEYFKAIVISHSGDLVNWQQIDNVFYESEDFDLTCFFDGVGIWTADILYSNGEFYIHYSLVRLCKDRNSTFGNRRTSFGSGGTLWEEYSFERG